MNITSLLITIAGIIIIIALYIMSRVTKSKMPSKQTSIIPKLKDKNGKKFTSVLDDIPARDGSTPVRTSVEATTIEAVDDISNNEEHNEEQTIKEKDVTISTTEPSETAQHVLFISEKDVNGLDGNLVKQALKSNGFVFGEMDIYHYMVNLETNTGMTSLFRVANGMAPWTLIDTDLQDKKLAGLSIVLLTPSKIDDEIAMKTFISVAEKLCEDVGGILKNDKQQILTEENKKNLSTLVKK